LPRGLCGQSRGAEIGKSDSDRFQRSELPLNDHLVILMRHGIVAHPGTTEDAAHFSMHEIVGKRDRRHYHTRPARSGIQ
jgi:hypothetical protein